MSAVRLEDLTPGAVVSGVTSNGLVAVVAVKWYGSNAINLTYRTDDGHIADQLLYRDHEARIGLREASSAYGFDGDGHLFKLAAEALRIRMAGRFDPMWTGKSGRGRSQQDLGGCASSRPRCAFAL